MSKKRSIRWSASANNGKLAFFRQFKYYHYRTCFLRLIYVVEYLDKTAVVFDRQQRLKSLVHSMHESFLDRQGFTLSGLQVMAHLNGKSFQDLSIEFNEILEAQKELKWDLQKISLKWQRK